MILLLDIVLLWLIVYFGKYFNKQLNEHWTHVKIEVKNGKKKQVWTSHLIETYTVTITYDSQEIAKIYFLRLKTPILSMLYNSIL